MEYLANSIIDLSVAEFLKYKSISLDLSEGWFLTAVLFPELGKVYMFFSTLY